MLLIGVTGLPIRVMRNFSDPGLFKDRKYGLSVAS